MAVTTHVFDRILNALGYYVDGYGVPQIDLLAPNDGSEKAELYVCLLNSSWTPDLGAQFYSQLTHEIADSGTYANGGQKLQNPQLVVEGHVVKLKADDVVWGLITSTFRYAVLWLRRVKDNPPYGFGFQPQMSDVVAYIDFGANQSPSAQSFTIAWAGGVVLTMEAA